MRAQVCEWFDRVVEAWGRAAPDRVSPPLAWASWLIACEKADAEIVGPAALRYLAQSDDPKRKRCKALDRWLDEERWAPWVASAGDQTTQPIGWTGPAEIRAAVVVAAGEDFARSYLDSSRWDGDRSAILTRTGFAADRLKRVAGLAEAGVLVVEKG